jgi:Na+/H+ antiporter NhaC
MAAGGEAVASPWRRVAAWMLDYLVILAYLIVLTATSIGTLSSPGADALSSALKRPILLLFIYLVSLFVGSQHRTIYDRIAGSRVMRTP